MSDAQLALAAVLGLATVVLLISAFRVHAFIALILGSAVLGAVSGMPPSKIVNSFTAGFGSTAASVGLVIALGAMMGGLLADSGGADGVVDQIVGTIPARGLPWAIAAVAALIGLPLFFEVGVVLLVPVVLLVGRRIRLPLMKIGIPALAGLSVLHGLVPPHPGPVAAIATLNADMGLTLVFGLMVAVPAVILAGPVYGAFISPRVHPMPPAAVPAARPPAAPTSPPEGDRFVGPGGGRRRPRIVTTIATMTLPVALMLLRAAGELLLPQGSPVGSALEIAGTPVVALLVGVIVAIVALGLASGLNRRQISDSMSGALPPIAAVLLIVAAGGGFKQTLVDAGVGVMVGRAAQGTGVSPLVLGWLVAVGIRLATGSATVATITAAGIVAPLAARMERSTVALMVLAVSSGSLFFSHVNDAGFWMVKEYFGLSMVDTLKSWSMMETIISVVGLIGVLVLHLFV